MSESSKVTGHKANIQKSIAFPYASNEQLEFDISSHTTQIIPKYEKILCKCNKIYMRSTCLNVTKCI